MEKRKFYLGIRTCGCVTASLVDDANTTASEVADFARRMALTKRHVEHREVDRGELEKLMAANCDHKPANTQVQP